MANGPYGQLVGGAGRGVPWESQITQAGFGTTRMPGVPGQPEQAMYAPGVTDTGRLAAPYRLGEVPGTEQFARGLLTGVRPEQDVLDRFRGEAMRDPGATSPWARVQLQQMQGQQQQAREAAKAQAAQQAQSAWQQMAMRGGAGRGARERLMGRAGEQAMMAGQRLGAEGRAAELGIRSQDEQRRLQMLQAMPGLAAQTYAPTMEAARMRLGARQQDVGREMSKRRWEAEQALQERRGAGASGLEAWRQQMQTYGAERQAQAQEEGK